MYGEQSISWLPRICSYEKSIDLSLVSISCLVRKISKHVIFTVFADPSNLRNYAHEILEYRILETLDPRKLFLRNVGNSNLRKLCTCNIWKYTVLGLDQSVSDIAKVLSINFEVET